MRYKISRRWLHTKYVLSEKEVVAIEKALNTGKGTYEVVLKKEEGQLVVLLSEKKKIY